MDPWLLLGALVTLCIIMLLAWLRQRSTGNAGLVDVLWTAALGLLAAFYAIYAEGWLPRRIVVGVLVGAWSLRLTVHLAQRVASESEDGRYAELRRQWASSAQRNLFLFFQAQALLAFGLSLVFLVLCRAEEAGWRWPDALAVLVWLTSLVGESIADAQLKRWRADPANKGRTCRRGLWAWSRHPNYFFEWLHWFVYPVLGIGLPWGWLLWLAPAMMLFLVLKVTGIPPTEAQSLRSRPDDYRAYQRTVNAFFPGPPSGDPDPSPETP